MERLPPELLARAKTELPTVAPLLPGLLVTVYGAANSPELADPGKLFQWSDDGRQSIEQAIYPRRRDSARSQRVQDAMNALEKYVQTFPMQESGCVNYGNVFFRLLRESHPANLIIASGKPYDKLGLKPAPGVSLPRTVVLVMVANSNHGQEFETFQQRELALRRIFPNARFLSESEIVKIPQLLSGTDADIGTFQVVVPKTGRQETEISKSTLDEKCHSDDKESPTGIQMRLEIVSPRNNERTGSEAQVEGTGACARSVWLVVYPIGTGTYWVQSRAEVRAGGAFRGSVILGRGGEIDCGATFLIRAFESPYAELRTGQQLSTWPSAQAASISVVVTRSCQGTGP